MGGAGERNGHHQRLYHFPCLGPGGETAREGLEATGHVSKLVSKTKKQTGVVCVFVILLFVCVFVVSFFGGGPRSP